MCGIMSYQIQIIRQPAILGIESKRAELSIKQPRPELEINQHEAWRAYNGGTALEMNQQIYSQLPALFLEGLAKRVEQGNRMAQFHLPENSIAEIYGQDWKRDPFVEFRAPASYDNVSIHVEPHRPEIEYNPGYLNVYVKQYDAIRFIPPTIELTM